MEEKIIRFMYFHHIIRGTKEKVKKKIKQTFSKL
jgi:hypothetical protein